jgi:hypothetical protein
LVYGLDPPQQFLLEPADLLLLQVALEDGEFIADEDLIEVLEGLDVWHRIGVVSGMHVPAFALLGREDLLGKGDRLVLAVEEVLLLTDLAKATLDLPLDAFEVELLTGGLHLL